MKYVKSQTRHTYSILKVVSKPNKLGMKTKFFFVLYSPSQINSFVKSGILEELSKSIDITVVIEKGKFSESAFQVNTEVLELEPLVPAVRAFSGLKQMSTLWRLKDRTMNHLVRANASFGTKKQRASWKCVVVSEMSLSFLKRSAIRLLSYNPFYTLLKIFEEGLSKFLFEKRAFREIGKNDVVLIPYSGHIGPDFDPWIRGANRRGIQTIAMQENWDNLSTKSFITEEPTYFCVWGRQSASHLRSVHRLFRVEPWIVGSPRFGLYFKGIATQPRVSNWSGESVELIEKSFVLVSGTGDGLDDELLIKLVYELLLSIAHKGFRLVYRPHPTTRTKLDYSCLSVKYPGILIDAGPEARKFGHHNALVRHARVVVNHFSTLMIESVLAGTKVMTPLFLGREDAEYRYSHLFNEWHHMMGLALVSGIYAPASSVEMRDDMCEILSNNSNLEKADISWICELTDYVESLLTNINRVVKHT